MTFKNLKRNRTIKKYKINTQMKHKKTIKNSKGGTNTSIMDKSASVANTLMNIFTGNDKVDYNFEPIPVPYDFIKEMCKITPNKNFYNLIDKN